MRILVTGAAGFIGSNFIELALTTQFPEIEHVIALDKLTYAGKLSNLDKVKSKPNFEFVKGDICDPVLINDLTPNVDAILNFAAESHVDRSIVSSTEFIHTNVLGTQVLLESARHNNIKKFIQISTDEVYGSIPEGSWDENAPVQPNSPYSASKAAADLLVNAYHATYGLNVNITRCSNNFGPRQDEEKLIPNVIGKIYRGQKVELYGDGLNVRDWIHVHDHCRAIYLVLEKGISGEIYNIGGGVEITNLLLVQKILNLTVKKGKEDNLIEFVEDRLGHDRRYSIDSEKIQSLGFIPHFDFEAYLDETVSWYLNEYKKGLKV
jgi:dTDP-glucose 4,6-dehydratase